MAQDDVLAILRIRYPDGRQEEVPLKKAIVDVGRQQTNDVVLNDTAPFTVSRKHARIQFESDRVTLTDLGSSNGTKLGDVMLPKNRPEILPYDQEFQMGDFRLVLVAVVRPVVQPPPAPVVLPEPEPVFVPAPEEVVQLDGVVFIPPKPPLPPVEMVEDDSYYQNGPLFGLIGNASRYVQYLPPIYRELDLVRRFLLGFEGVAVPIEQVVDNFDLYLDPLTTPESFLEHLADWLGMTLNQNWTVEQRRTLIAEAFTLYSWRGTRKGLSRHLEIYTGFAPEILEPENRAHFFQVVLPNDARKMDEQVIHRIIKSNQPAHTSYELKFAPPAR